MHHKRRRSRNQRSCCKLCKPWKISGFNLFDQLKPSENRLIQPEEGRPPKRHKASRTKWCRGKEGVEHQTVCMTHKQAKGPARYPRQALDRYLVCKVCGKELAHHCGSFGEKNKPDWVDQPPLPPVPWAC